MKIWAYIFPLTGCSLIRWRIPPPGGTSGSTLPKLCMWYYQTSDGMCYQWKVETSNNKDDANQILAAGESVDRGVLSIKETGKYMTVDAELTADTYVAGQQKRYLRMVWLSGGYLLLYLVVWVVVKCCRKKDKEKRKAI